MLRLALALVAFSSVAYADPVTAKQVCATAADWLLQGTPIDADPDGRPVPKGERWLSLTAVDGSSDDYKSGAVRVDQRTDLDGDKRLDMIVTYYDSCGNRGECMHAVLVSCGKDQWAPVIMPDYYLERALAAKTARCPSGW